MRSLSRILIIFGFIASSLLGGFVATVLHPIGAQAAPMASFGPEIKITALSVPNASIQTITTTPIKFADIGNFTVQNSGSLIEVTHQGRIYIETISGFSGVYFQLRVDDQPPLANTGLASIPQALAGKEVPDTFSGYWQGLGAGNHNLSVWIYAPANQTGTASWANINYGSNDSNVVIIKEYLPFGTTMLPLIER